ncbi:MAG: sulfatase-like hydrolase/transferase, partial [Dehalococcoidia bacterium]|nr:sulfatase-like hydrolase/transferase [Dehalococcoidia bacterium]
LPMWFPESTPLPNEDYLDTWTGQQVVDWIDNYDGDQPFFQWVGFPGPHEPHDAPKDYADLYRNVEIPIGERIPPEVPESGPLHTLMRWLQTTAQWEGLTDDIVQLLTRYYYANITAIDDQVGAIVEALDRKGILDNTWIIYTADHGEMMGDHWMLWKMLFYEQSATVPLIIRPPGGMESHTVDGIVEHVDVTATIEALTGIAPLPDNEGNSLLGHVDGSGGPTREVAHSENYGFGMFATDRYKLVVFEDTKEPVQLFDLQEDPEENVNVVADPAYADVVAQMLSDHVEPFLATPPKRPAKGIWEVQAGRYEGNRHLAVRYPK